RCRTVALTAASLLAQYVKSLGEKHLCVVSPDPGGVKRAQLFRETLEAACGFPIGRGFVEKRRSAGKVSGDLFVGEAEGATALVVDDLIASGGTLLRAARAVRDHGTQKVVAFATHGLFMKGATEALADPAIDRVVVCDTVPASPATSHTPKAGRDFKRRSFRAGNLALASGRTIGRLAEFLIALSSIAVSFRAISR